MTSVVSAICGKLDYYRLTKHQYPTGVLPPREEEYLRSILKLHLRYNPEVYGENATAYGTRWATEISTSIWGAPYLTERTKMELSDMIASKVCDNVAYGPKMTVKQSYLKVAERTGLHPDQVQVVVESIMALAVERIALGEEFDIADRIRLKKTRGKKTKVRARCMHKLFVDVGRNTAPPEVHTPQLFFN